MAIGLLPLMYFFPRCYCLILILFTYVYLQRTFHFNSSFWSDKAEYNLKGGMNGFDSQETKLPSYWNTSFSKVCLGMGIGFQLKFIVFNKRAAHFTRWSLTVNTARYHSVVTHEGPSLAQKLPYSPTATWKGSMLWLINGPPRQELVSLPTKKTIARAVTLELGLVPEGILITSTRVETKQSTKEIMETNTLKPWGTSWCSDKESYEQPLKPRPMRTFKV